MAGRIDHGYDCRPDLCATKSSKRPSEYLGQFHTDCIVHGDTALRCLVSTIGPEKIVMGSDYPFPLGEVTGSAPGVYPGRYVDDANFISDAQKAAILSTNALELLGLDAADFARRR